jgi:hypothetical protein
MSGCSTYDQWLLQSLKIVTEFCECNQVREDEVRRPCWMIGKAERKKKKTLGGHRSRQDDNIKIDLGGYNLG